MHRKTNAPLTSSHLSHFISALRTTPNSLPESLLPSSFSRQFTAWQHGVSRNSSRSASSRLLTPFLTAAVAGAVLGGSAQADSAPELPQLSVAPVRLEPFIRSNAKFVPVAFSDEDTPRESKKSAPVLLAQADSNQTSNNQPSAPAAAPGSRVEPEGLKVPLGRDKSDTLPQPKPPVGAEANPGVTTTPGPRVPGSTLPRPGGSSLPSPTITTPATAAAAAQPGVNSEAIAQAEGREVATVRIVGLRVIPEESVLLQATNIRRGAAFAQRQAELDRGRINGMGFFASVQYQVTPNLEDPTKVDVAFVVVENRVVTGFKFDGNKTILSADLLKVLQTKTGAVLNNNTLNEDVDRVQALYRERGYASLVTQVKQEEDGNVSFIVEEARIAKVVLSGLRKTRESLVRKLIRSKPGEAFDQRRLQRDLNSIFDTGFFEDVTYKLDDDPDVQGGLIITIGVKEKRTGTFTLGVGFDSRSKVSGFLTLAETNFNGSGRRVAGSIEIGSQRTFDLSYGNPFIGSKNASYNAEIYSRRIFREPRTVNLITGQPITGFYEENRTGGRLDYTMPLDFNRTRNLIFGFRNERARLFNVDPTTGNPTPLDNQPAGQVFAPSIGFVRDKRDLRLDPSRGSREQFVVEKAFSFLGGDSDFTKIDLDLRRYIPLMKPAKKNELPKLVLAGRAVIGKSFGQLPAFEQYFVGGSDTVRGYNSDEQFGDNQIYGNVELRYRLQRKFQIVGFIDVGSAYGGQFSSSNSINTMVGIGAGVRVQTPIGPIRLDIGRGDDGIHTHFGIGASF